MNKSKRFGGWLAVIIILAILIIDQTIKKNLPKGFQRAKKLEECGFVDMICQRKDQRSTIAGILRHHIRTGAKYE